MAADRYAVMGYPISHSRSPVIHHLFARQSGQNMQYDRIEVQPARLEKAVRQFQRDGGKGLNITVPHKSEVTKLVDHLTERASTAGAVNTLTFRDEEIFGDNTDGFGLLRDLVVNLGVTVEDADILVFGAGGATRGIIGPLLEMQPKSLCIANRSLSKARPLAEYFSHSGPVTCCRFNAVPKEQQYDLIINATSAGLRGEVPPFPDSAVAENTVCYDLAYGLKPTPFTIWGREQGAAQSVLGWGMLVEQAAESFRIWRGVRPDTAAVLAELPVSA